MTNSELGARGEDAAAAYLTNSGHTVVDRNWKCKAGEVDIVALDADEMVFVEVKTRRTESTGTPEEAVSATKQKRYARIAKAYLQQAGQPDLNVRFDVIGIRPISDDRALLRHHKDAFVVS